MEQVAVGIRDGVRVLSLSGEDGEHDGVVGHSLAGPWPGCALEREGERSWAVGLAGLWLLLPFPFSEKWKRREQNNKMVGTRINSWNNFFRLSDLYTGQQN